MEDPTYREYMLARNRRLPLPTISQGYRELYAAASLVGNTYEDLGILAKNNIIDRNIFLDQYAWNIAGDWDAMRSAVAWTRAVSGKNAIWENFEYLTVLAEDCIRERASTYPKGVRRLQLRNPWPVPPMPATV